MFGAASVSSEQIEPRRLIKSKKYTQLAIGGSYTLAICTEGVLYGWGSKFAGNKSSSHEPVVIESDIRFVKVASGKEHAAAIDTNGLLYTWGHGGSWFSGGGQLGHGDSESLDKPR